MNRERSRIFSPMHRAVRQFQILADEYTRRHGIAADEGHALLYVCAYGPCPTSELARVMGIRPSTLSSVIARLMRKKCIRRAPGADRRVWLLSGTTAGKRLATELRRFALRLEADVLRRLTPADTAALERALATIHATLGVPVRPVTSQNTRSDS